MKIYPSSNNGEWIESQFTSLIRLFLNYLPYNMSEDQGTFPSQGPRVQGHMFPVLILSNQQSFTKNMLNLQSYQTEKSRKTLTFEFWIQTEIAQQTVDGWIGWFDVHVPLRMNCSNFGDLLTFHLAPSSGQISFLSFSYLFRLHKGLLFVVFCYDPHRIALNVVNLP